MDIMEPTLSGPLTALVDAFDEVVRARLDEGQSAEAGRREADFAAELEAVTAKHLGSVYVAHPDYYS